MPDIESYKQDIYESWAQHGPDTSPPPSQEYIERRVRESRLKIVDTFMSVEPTKRVLDLGCGYGFFLKACQQAGYRDIQGVDTGGSFVRFGNKLLEKDVIIQANLFEYLQNTSETFDYITAFDVLEHQKKSDLIPLLKLIFSRLSVGGKFIFQAPNGESLSGMYIYHSDLTHEIAFTRHLIAEILPMAGFHHVETYPSYINTNPLIRLAQRALALVFGRKKDFMFSSNILGIGIK